MKLPMLYIIDKFLNAFTMYRVVFYGLASMANIAIILGLLRLLPFSATSLIFSLVVAVVVAQITNLLIARFLHAVTNVESSLITGLIIFFLFPPLQSAQGAIVIATASAMAVASKYLFVFGRKHLFNPVAMGAVVVSAIGIGGATWWVATPTMLPVVLVVGLLVVRKVRRFWLVSSFLVSGVVSISIANWSYISSYPQFLGELVWSWPLLFLGTIMLTEPLTTPPSSRLQAMYGVLVGGMLGLRYSVGPFFSTPEMALLIGNVFSYLVSPKQKLFLELDAKRILAPSVYEFAFRPSRILHFLPGQYMEWTLPHTKPDTRGNRRFFTIASSPTEEALLLGVKVPAEFSSFKRHLTELEKGGTIIASQLAGEFTLPPDVTTKLVCIAGGIGVTPFRSMAKYLIDTKQNRDIVHFYCSANSEEFVYQDIFSQAEKRGMHTKYVITQPDAVPPGWMGLSGRLNETIISQHVPDYLERVFYLSGPHAMVVSYKTVLLKLGVARNHIKEDYFPGF